jgi:hypothetical protein
VPLGDVTESVLGVPRFKHVYQYEGVPYLDSEDLFKLNSRNHQVHPRCSGKATSKLLLPPPAPLGWVSVAALGQSHRLDRRTEYALYQFRQVA